MKSILKPEHAADDFQRYPDGSIRCPVHLHAVLPGDGEHVVFQARAAIRADQVSSVPAGAVSHAFRMALAEAGIDLIDADARFLPAEHDHEEPAEPQP